MEREREEERERKYKSLEYRSFVKGKKRRKMICRKGRLRKREGKGKYGKL